MITREQMLKIRRWYYPHITSHENMIMSGWKLYVYGEDVDDSMTICTLLIPIMKKYNLTMKVATQYVIDRNTSKKNVAWSIAVIYLSVEIFSEGNVRNLLSDIKSSLTDYPKKGQVTGAKSIDDKLHYRYDLKESVKPEVGVSYDKYISLYRGEAGDYNIPDNQDIESHFK